MPEYLRRRVWWLDGDRAQVDLQDKNSIEGKYTFHWEKEIDPDSEQLGGRLYKIYFEGLLMETFKRPGQVKLYLLRMAYDIGDAFLIPSELLFDAEMSYLDRKTWVDSFRRVASGDRLQEEIILGISDIVPPEDRKIKLAPVTFGTKAQPQSKPKTLIVQKWETVTTPRSTKTYSGQTAEERDWERYENYMYGGYYKPKNIPARPADGSCRSPVPLDWEDQSWEGRSYKNPPDVDIPDEECFFLFPSKKAP